MDDQTRYKILRLIDDLDGLLRANDQAQPNPAVLNQVQSLCMQLKPCDSYVSITASDLLEKAGRFYSARKHQRDAGGAATLHRDMVNDLLERMRTRVTHLKS